MSGAQGPCAHPAVCTPGRRVGSAALGVHRPWRAFSWATVVTPWLPASPDQQQVSSEGNARPSRSPSEGRASHGKARPGACYKTRPPAGAERKGAGGHQGCCSPQEEGCMGCGRALVSGHVWGSGGRRAPPASGTGPSQAWRRLQREGCLSISDGRELGREEDPKPGGKFFQALTSPGQETVRGQRPRGHGGAAWVPTNQLLGQTNAFRTEPLLQMLRCPAHNLLLEAQRNRKA